MSSNLLLIVTVIAIALFVYVRMEPKYSGSKEDRKVAYAIEEFGNVHLNTS